MRILYIKKQYNNSKDGGDIYDFKLINGLSKLGNDVTEYSILKADKGLIPFWKWKIKKHDIVRINQIENNFDKIIISHENLADLTDHVRCDLFIFHNLMSRLKTSFFFLKFFYKLGASFHENKAIRNSKKFLVLSYREYLSINNARANYCAPGINENIPMESDKSIIYIPSSSGWILKKKSKLSKSEIYNLRNYFNIQFGNIFSKVGIIEDKFDCGFKLRLIQMLFSCDLIITKINFDIEVKALGCSPGNIFQFNDFSKLDFNFLFSKVDHKINEKNKIHLLKKHNWNSISKNIINILNNES